MEENHLKTLSKTEDELRVGNYMAIFGGKDLTGEHFTKDTEFESNYTRTGALYVDWEHGLDYDDPESPQRDDILGVVDWKTAKKDERGLWVERVLSRRNEYMTYLEELIEEGLIGTSSEAIGGKVRKTKDGEIQLWPLKRDALTVQPAEPRMMKENVITAIKALSEFNPHLKALLKDQVMVKTGEDTGEITHTHVEVISNPMEGKTMTDSITLNDEQFKELLNRSAPSEVSVDDSAEIKALTEKIEAMADLIQNSPVAKDSGYVAPDSEADHPEAKSFGDYLVAVRQKNTKRIETVYKTALAEGAGATGGYGVPVEYGGLLLDMAKEFNALRKAGALTTTISGNSKSYPVFDIETAPSAGDTAYAGGAIAYWTEEAGSITESEPRFREVKLVAHKLAAYSLASAEVRDDFVESIDGIMARSFAKAIGSKEEYAFFRGDGVGKPLGIMAGGGILASTRSAASTIALADLSQMISDLTPDSYNSAAFFCSPTCLDQVIQLVSAPLSWMDNMRDSWMQPTLLGYPLYVVGCLPALNSDGDFLLVDPNYYIIADHVGGMNIAFSEHFKFQNDQLAWRITKRVDGQPLIANNITLEDASTTVSPYVYLAT